MKDITKRIFVILCLISTFGMFNYAYAYEPINENAGISNPNGRICMDNGICIVNKYAGRMILTVTLNYTDSETGEKKQDDYKFSIIDRETYRNELQSDYDGTNQRIFEIPLNQTENDDDKVMVPLVIGPEELEQPYFDNGDVNSNYWEELNTYLSKVLNGGKINIQDELGKLLMKAIKERKICGNLNSEEITDEDVILCKKTLEPKRDYKILSYPLIAYYPQETSYYKIYEITVRKKIDSELASSEKPVLATQRFVMKNSDSGSFSGTNAKQLLQSSPSYDEQYYRFFTKTSDGLDQVNMITKDENGDDKNFVALREDNDYYYIYSMPNKLATDKYKVKTRYPIFNGLWNGSTAAFTTNSSEYDNLINGKIAVELKQRMEENGVCGDSSETHLPCGEVLLGCEFTVSSPMNGVLFEPVKIGSFDAPDVKSGSTQSEQVIYLKTDLDTFSYTTSDQSIYQAENTRPSETYTVKTIQAFDLTCEGINSSFEQTNTYDTLIKENTAQIYSTNVTQTMIPPNIETEAECCKPLIYVDWYVGEPVSNSCTIQGKSYANYIYQVVTVIHTPCTADQVVAGQAFDWGTYRYEIKIQKMLGGKASAESMAHSYAKLEVDTKNKQKNAADLAIAYSSASGAYASAAHCLATGTGAPGTCGAGLSDTERQGRADTMYAVANDYATKSKSYQNAANGMTSDIDLYDRSSSQLYGCVDEYNAIAAKYNLDADSNLIGTPLEAYYTGIIAMDVEEPLMYVAGHNYTPEQAKYIAKGTGSLLEKLSDNDIASNVMNLNGKFITWFANLKGSLKGFVKADVEKAMDDYLKDAKNPANDAKYTETDVNNIKSYLKGAHADDAYNAQEKFENHERQLIECDFCSVDRLTSNDANYCKKIIVCDEPDCETPTPTPIICDDPHDCKAGNGLNIVYRTISITDPFPQNREPSVPWDNEIAVDKLIKNARNYEGYDLYNNATPMYTIELTPATINEIRTYNKEHSYNDFDLECEKGTNYSGLYCLSNNFVRTKLVELGALKTGVNESCAYYSTDSTNWYDCISDQGSYTKQYYIDFLEGYLDVLKNPTTKEVTS